MSFDVVIVECSTCGESWQNAVIQPIAQIVSRLPNVFFQPQQSFLDPYG